ncbi:MAG: hypothetical protein IT328_19610 [Caldilineaceae bacterium]|nr:hypothetical protein [Caldilineaceae bacterium]
MRKHWVNQRIPTYASAAHAQPRLGNLPAMDAKTARPPYPLLVLFAALILLTIFLAIVPPAEWVASVVYLGVSGVGMVLLYRTWLKRIDPTFPAALFVLAYLVKLASSVARYWMAYDLYDGSADSRIYHEHGQILAQYFKSLDFSIIGSYVVRGEGTTNLAYITGLLYTVMPASLMGAFFFFATLAFTGTVLFYCAARVAWPETNLRLYTLYIFFLPSILFWPASLGKDAWMLFWSGLAAWSWVNFVRRQRLLGLLWIAIALLMLQLVRPHVAAFLALAIGASYLLYMTRGQRSILTWLVGLIVVVGLGYYTVQGGADYLHLQELSTESLQAAMVEVQENTSRGGSRYEVVSIFTPTGFVTGLVTAAVRPFPWEANSGQMLLTSLETVGWGWLCWIQRRTFWHRLRSIRKDPVAAFALTYTLLTFLALTSMGNFGIIARQRVMALPFLWMLFI